MFQGGWGCPRSSQSVEAGQAWAGCRGPWALLYRHCVQVADQEAWSSSGSRESGINGRTQVVPEIGISNYAEYLWGLPEIANSQTSSSDGCESGEELGISLPRDLHCR